MWFHGTYLKDKFHAGQTVALFGKVEPSRSKRGFKMIQPQFEILPTDLDDDRSRLLEVGRITPVYESLSGTSKLASRWKRSVIHGVLEELKGQVPETLPAAIAERLQFPSREVALRDVHFPEAGTPFVQLQSWATAAHRRLDLRRALLSRAGAGTQAAQMRRARRRCV